MAPGYTPNHQQNPPAFSGEILSGQIDGPRCADCTSYPLSFHDQERFCRTIMRTVAFLSPACSKQAERARPANFGLERMKLAQGRKTLSHLSWRLQKGMDLARKAHEKKKKLQAVRDDIAAYRDGENERLLNREHTGIVYFIRCGRYVKIGHTNKPIKQRICALKSGNPFDLVLIGFCPGDAARERDFHAHLKEHHHRMEWFHMDERFIRRIRNMIARAKGSFFKEGLVSE